jgi:hypothetical protein
MSSLLLYPHPLAEILDDDGPLAERDNCLVPQTLWKRWVETQTAEVLLLTFQQAETQFVLCVEGPHNESSDVVYIPRRYIQDLIPDEYVQVEVLKTMPPKATKISLQPLDNELYHCDIASAVSRYLSHWNVLSANTILSVPCEELGGFLVDVFVKHLEPESTVLLRGEVPLDLEESMERVQEWEPRNVIVPLKSQPSTAIIDNNDMDDFGSMIPMPITPSAPNRFPGKGYSLSKK